MHRARDLTETGGAYSSESLHRARYLASREDKKNTFIMEKGSPQTANNMQQFISKRDKSI